MKIIAKRFRFHGYWEIVMVDGQVHFLVKDILHHFGYSESSHGIVTSVIQEDDKMILRGDQLKDIKRVKGRGLVINKAGLIQFIHHRLEGKIHHTKAINFLAWVHDKVIPEMKRITEVDKEIEPGQESEKPNLFDVVLEQKVENMNEIMKGQSETIQAMQKTIQKHWKRIQELEMQIKQNRMGKAVHTEGGRKMVDVDEFIQYMQGMDASGNIKG